MAVLYDVPSLRRELDTGALDPTLYDQAPQPDDPDYGIESLIPLAGALPEFAQLTPEPAALTPTPHPPVDPILRGQAAAPAIGLAAPGVATLDEALAEHAASRSIIGESLPEDELVRRSVYMETLRRRVPGVDANVAYQLAVSGTPIDEATRLARAQTEQQNRSFFSSIFSPIGRVLKATFIDAPNWLWNRTVVDLMQEIAELGGAPSEVAQRLSPGQALVGLLPGDLGAQRDGEWLDPAEWSGPARWASGGMDIVLSLTADPTNALLGMRAFRALPFGLERAFGITRGARGGLIPTPLVRGLRELDAVALAKAASTIDGEKIARVSEALFTDSNVFRNFVAGHIKTTELVSFVRGHNPFREAAQFVADSSKHSVVEGMAKISRRFPGKMDARTVAVLAALGHEGPEAVMDGVTAMLSGRTPSRLAELVSDKAEHYLTVKAEAIRAANQAQLLERSRAGIGHTFDPTVGPMGRNVELANRPYIVDPVRNLSLEPPMNLPFSAKLWATTDPNIPLTPPVPIAFGEAPIEVHRYGSLGAFDPPMTMRTIRERRPGESVREGVDVMPAIEEGAPVTGDPFRAAPPGVRNADDELFELETGVDVGHSQRVTGTPHTELQPDVELQAIEEGVPGPRDPLMPPPPSHDFDSAAARNLPGADEDPVRAVAAIASEHLNVPAEYLQDVIPIGRELNAARTEIERLGALFPNLREALRGVSTVEEAEGLIDMARALSPDNLLQDIPRTFLSADGRKFYDNFLHGYRKVPVLRSFDVSMQAKAEVNYHDPMAHEQIRRMAIDFGMDPQTQDQWLQRWFAEAVDERRARVVAQELVREGWRKVFTDTGLTSATARVARRLGKDADRLAEMDPEEVLDRFVADVAARRNEIYSSAKGVRGDRVRYESQFENIIELADPRLIRMFKRSFDRWLISNPNPTWGQFIKGVDATFDGINTFLKRIWVARPATGLRITLENQARAAMAGMSSAFTHPVMWGALTLAPYSKSAARRIEQLKQMAIDSGDLGMIRSMRYAGLMSKQEARGAFKVYTWKEVSDSGSDALRRWYLQAHARRLNDIIVNDRLAQRIIHSSPREGRIWLLSADAEEYRRKMRINDPEKAKEFWRDTVRDMRESKVFDPRVREALRTGQVEPEDLADWGDDAIAATLPTGDIYTPPPLSRAWASEQIDKVVNRFLAEPDEIGRRFVARAEIARLMSVEVGKHPGVNLDTLADLLRGGKPPRAGRELEYALYETSLQKAQEKVRFLFYDLSESSRMADIARFIAPFGNAYQEMVTRWTRLVADRPWLPHLAARAFDASANIPGVTYRDPETGEVKFMVPLADHMLNFAGLRKYNPVTGEAEGMGIPLTGHLQGINMVTGNGGLPGFGPYLQFPAAWLAKNTPQLDDIWRLIFPFGQQIGFTDMLPGWMRSMGAAISDPDQHYRFGNITKSYLGAEMAAAIARGEDVSDVRQFLDDHKIVRAARLTYAIRAVSQFVAPTSVAPDHPFREQVEFYRWARGIDEDLADQMFIARWGSHMFAAVQAMTVSETRNANPPTSEFRRWVQNPQVREWNEAYGAPFRDLVRESWEGDLEPVELGRQLATGERRPLRLDEFGESAGASVAWKRWSLLNLSLSRMMFANGISPREKAAEPVNLIKRQTRIALSMAFPSWAREYHQTGGGRVRRAENITTLARLAGIQELSALESHQALRKYFALRSVTRDALDAMEVKSFGSKKAHGVAMWFHVQVMSLVKEHPSFARIWAKYFLTDQLEPLAELITVGGAFEAPTPGLDAETIIEEVA